MIDIERLKLVIETKNTFAVVSHTSPDGDSMGSILSFYNFLIEKGKRVDVFVEGQVPRKYLYLNGANEIKNVDLAQESYDCLIVLDCGDLDRLGECMPLTEKCDLIINIDHHITNTRFGNINIVDSNASSVGEMLYDIYLQLGHNISKNIAECLYTSIVSDTGGFKF
ncbi:DHH family phosphoesterase, partial [Thermobrachium celere]